ncbi:MAG: hypothetical protein ETSY1_08515 [Candidatus Entotheonella factor]|uniref:Flavocytochrome c sulphide dehydrogenase flavin-binding domain-containing protein n=1 Tax=Entotheonella factor TaxID=1429438 RepID=W4LTE8_ENTF1|nr:MAG: hypothetical protein ETSY1_08515 [Candidatus Entotheonella factor]
MHPGIHVIGDASDAFRQLEAEYAVGWYDSITADMFA